uniref:Uncharacterized protein n=1 Tax=Tanacetum cinerariifolium TaxID=118510 RepID=A0A699VI43_TANCI|nr:hypothetical protein [Tanacetum cinerariifolium]
MKLKYRRSLIQILKTWPLFLPKRTAAMKMATIAPKSQETGRKESYRQGSKAEEKSSKALMAIDRVG